MQANLKKACPADFAEKKHILRKRRLHIRTPFDDDLTAEALFKELEGIGAQLVYTAHY